MIMDLLYLITRSLLDFAIFLTIYKICNACLWTRTIMKERISKKNDHVGLNEWLFQVNCLDHINYHEGDKVTKWGARHRKYEQVCIWECQVQNEEETELFIYWDTENLSSVVWTGVALICFPRNTLILYLVSLTYSLSHIFD